MLIKQRSKRRYFSTLPDYQDLSTRTKLFMTNISEKANPPSVSHFIRQIIERDNKQGKWQQGDNPRALPIITRFPPEPNGYLHIGHAKAIYLNFGLANDYGGRCHLRFDDTNPAKEDEAYEHAIIETVRWLGFDWGTHCYYASSYYQTFYECALALIRKGLAYVDSQDAKTIRCLRGTLTEAGTESPYRNRSIEENLELFGQMKAGVFPNGAHVLRAKIDMASPNINMRDPTIYRIRHEHHYRTGNNWCIYPMYDYAHCLSDALENVTHSFCTLEFESHRPLYEWFLQQLIDFFPAPHPQQIEFARLNISQTVTSKRKLLALVEAGKVSGWDDPRMPTIMGLRRRGFSPNSIIKFCEMIGVSKSNTLIDMVLLEECLRDDLNNRALRRIAIINPLKLVIENYPEDKTENVQAPNHPQKTEWGHRELHFSRVLWIERDDFQAEPVKGFFRLAPNAEVRLRYGYIIQCNRFETDTNGDIITVYATYDPDSKSGVGSSPKKVKGNIHWLSEKDCRPATARFVHPLFTSVSPDQQEDYFTDLNPNSWQQQSILIEKTLSYCEAEAQFQFERNGYFCADRYDHKPNQHAVFNQIVPLKAPFKKR